MAKLKATTYDQLCEAVRPHKTRTIGNNTTTTRVVPIDAPHRFQIRLHGNRIAAVGPDAITISTAGWDTVTTRERLNQFLAPFDARVHRIKGNLVITTKVSTDSPVTYDWDGSPFRITR